MSDGLSDYEEWTGNFDTRNSETVANLHLAEVQRQRTAQDKYVDDLRSRSLSMLGIVSASVLVVSAFAEVRAIPAGYLGVASLGVALLVLCAVQVHRPRDGFRNGPDLSTEISARQERGDLFVLVSRDLAHWLAEN